jgi:multisubunit Na+/H+ antiporter MnhB subunit
VTPTVLTRFVSRVLFAPTIVVALAILVKGYIDPGDGFSAGVVVALGVLLQALAFGHRAVADALPLHRAGQIAVAGLAVAVGVAIVPVLLGGSLLEHAPPPDAGVVHVGTLELITAVAFDVGVFLLVAGAIVAIVHALAIERVEEGPT